MSSHDPNDPLPGWTSGPPVVGRAHPLHPYEGGLEAAAPMLGARAPEPLPLFPSVGPAEMAKLRADGTVTRLIGERLRWGVYRELSPEEIEVCVQDSRNLDSIQMRLIRQLVSFEMPDEETVVSIRACMASENVPVSWWDHWKQAHPRLARFLGCRSPVVRKIETHHDTTHVHKHFNVYPCQRRS